VPLLRGKTVVNLFFEPAPAPAPPSNGRQAPVGRRAQPQHPPTSSASKGESLLDTLRNLEAMHTDMFVVRHAEPAPRTSSPGTSAARGRHQRRRRPPRPPDPGACWTCSPSAATRADSSLQVAIVGDILHSRVARSQIHALNTSACAEVRVIAPKHPAAGPRSSSWACTFTTWPGLKDVDVVIMLRLQRSAWRARCCPSEQEFFRSTA
jgi:aspartate carbamoyltransferase catalytic subunit